MLVKVITILCIRLILSYSLSSTVYFDCLIDLLVFCCFQFTGISASLVNLLWYFVTSFQCVFSSSFSAKYLLDFFVISDDFVFFATSLCWLNYGMYYSKRAEWRTTRLFLILYLVFLGMKMCILFEYLRHIFLFICNILYKLIWLNLTSFLASHKIHQAWE